MDHRTLAEVALQSARRLDPDAGEVHYAYAVHFHHASQDPKQALIEAELAERKLPNDPSSHFMLGVIERDQGRWDEALRQLRKASDLSPCTLYPYNYLAETSRTLRRYAEADRAYAREIALQTASESTEDRLVRALCPFEENGDLEPLRAVLAAVDPADDPDAENRTMFGLIVALCSHDADAVSRLAENAVQPSPGRYGFHYPKAWFSSLAARMRGDADGARAAFTAARVEMARTALSDLSNPRLLSQLAMIDAGLGRKEEAIKEAKQACDMLPLSASDVTAPELVTCLAVVYAWTGEPDSAFALLSERVGQPAGRNLWYRPTYGDLKLSPVWDPLRGDPRFAPLMERLAPHPVQ